MTKMQTDRRSSLVTRSYIRARSILGGFRRGIRKGIARGLARRQLPKLSGIVNPFFVVGLPGCLHVADLCFQCIPDGINSVLVSNGLENWEQQWAREHLKAQSTITLGPTVRHGAVLDLLFDHLSQPFGILDYDCFVFDPAFFHRLTPLAPRSLSNALFKYVNPVSGLEVPETFALFFNTPVIRLLRRRYRVSCDEARYSRLSARVRSRLAEIGIDEHHPPEANKRFFDTFRLLLCLGYADGYACSFVGESPAQPVQRRGVFHVGGVGGGIRSNCTATNWELRGSYFWRRALEAHPDEALRRRYSGRYGDLTARQLLADNSGARERIGAEFIDFAERIVQRESPPFEKRELS
jgi:hypothetical protein